MKVKSFLELGALFQRKLETKPKVPFGTVTNSQGLTSALKTRPLYNKTDKGYVFQGNMTVLEKSIPLRAF